MSTSIKTITGRFEGTFSYEDSELSLTRFAGGHNGAMIQVTIWNHKECAYVQFTKEQIGDLIKTLQDSFNYDKYPSE